MEGPKSGWYGGESHKDGKEALRKSVEQLLAENREQDNIIGLHEWDQEVTEQEHGIDHLTQAHTRKYFEAELDRSLKLINGEMKEQRHGGESMKEISLLFIDLDHFKQVNDGFGHDTGDSVLKRVSDIMRSTLRTTDMLARLGGDEFVVLLPHTDEAHAHGAAENLRAHLANDAELQKFNVTGSVGIASAKAGQAIDPKTLLNQADKAAYASKKGGKNQVTVYAEGMGERGE